MCILDFYKLGEQVRKSREYRCKNPMCQTIFKRRSDSNDPAFCSYACGATSQPEHCKPVLRHDYSGNNQKS